MMLLMSDDFLTTRAWHRAVVGGKEMILRSTSALEFLELFGGYMREKKIDVYAKRLEAYENIDYRIVDSFDNIDYIRLGDVLCTSVNQTFNDMLYDYNSVDEQSLVEGLSRYYYTHDTSFEGLIIKPENLTYFNSIKNWAIEYYSEG